MKYPLLHLLALMTLCTLAFAESEFKDEIRMPSKFGAVTFSHAYHSSLEGIECTSCHHTEEEGNITQGCHDCHGEKSEGAPNTRKAFHNQCIGCHKRDTKQGKVSGPTSACRDCHVKGN